jgi:adenosylmethionine-8-amino-7-oxononanoate aminotransferase
MTAARPTLVRAEGLHVWDREGRRYLDGVSGAFCAALGYSRPDLIRAMSDAAERLPFARRAVFENPEAEAYGRELVQAVGPPFTRVLLTSSGSEAVEAALKIAYRYQCASGRPDRRGFGFRPGHYHGATLGALAVTGLRARRGPYEALPGVGPAAPGPRESAAAPVPREGPRAAEILETIPAAGLGAPVPEPGFLARVRAECDGAGALWIADEVLTGFGRTGSLFAWQRLGEREADRGVTPDLVVFGKAAGAGYAALGGVLMVERVARALDAGPEPERFTHYQTYGGHPVAAAVGRAVLRALERPIRASRGSTGWARSTGSTSPRIRPRPAPTRRTRAWRSGWKRRAGPGGSSSTRRAAGTARGGTSSCWRRRSRRDPMRSSRRPRR